MPGSVAAISAGLKKVPPFPPVAVKLLNLFSSPSVDANEVADLIASDATFTARLLQRINSAEFGLISDVTSVRRAVGLLGLDTTHRITLAHAAASYAQGGLRTETMRRSWQHTVATAVLADEIAAACGESTGAAFTAGIMHDIGRLGLLVAYPELYERVIRNAAERCLDVLDFEQEEFGAHHAEAGRILAESWGLPAEMLLIVGRHHDPCEGSEVNLLRIVHVACRLADVLGYDVVHPLTDRPVSDVLDELPPQARGQISQDPEEFRQRIEGRIQEFDPEGFDQPPEETLALLVSVSQAPDSEPAGGEPQRVAEEIPAGSNSSEPGAQAGKPKPRKWRMAVWIAAALLAAAAIAFLALR
jgi:HD-like signal output (HDOD) protein